MVNQITNWTHTGIIGNQNTNQNIFYVRYQLPGQAQINLSEVASIPNGAGANIIGIATGGNNIYSLLNYNLALNDYYYCFNTSQISQIAGLVNGTPAIQLGNSPLAVLQNLALTLSFQSPSGNIQSQIITNTNNPATSVYTTGSDGALTSNNVSIQFNAATNNFNNIWVQFGQGSYTVNAQNSGFGSLIPSSSLATVSTGSDTQLITTLNTDNQLFFDGISANVVTDIAAVSPIQNGAPISFIANPNNPQTVTPGDVWMLSMRTLSIYRPISTFTNNGVTYYMLTTPNGTLLNSAQTRVSIIKPNGVVADGNFAPGEAPAIYIPCTAEQVPQYIQVTSIPIVSSSEIPAWEAWIQSTVGQNLSSQNKNIFNGVMNLINSVVNRFFKKSS